MENGTALRTFKGHEGWVRSVAFTPDGRYVATGGADKSARLWETQTGHEVRRFTGHTSSVYSVAIGPSGRFLATAAGHTLGGVLDDTRAVVWDLESGALVRTFTHGSGLYGVAFSPDGKSLATAGYEKIARVWDVRTGRQLLALSGHADIVSSVDFSPDGKHIVTGSLDRTARIWDAVSGDEKLTIYRAPSAVTWVAFGADNRRLAILTGGWPHWSKSENGNMSNPRLAVIDSKTGDNLLNIMEGESPVQVFWSRSVRAGSIWPAVAPITPSSGTPVLVFNSIPSLRVRA